MEVLVLPRKLWKYFGLCYSQESFQFLSIFINVFVILGLTELMSFSLLYLYFYKPNDVYRITYVSLQSFFSISALMPYIISVPSKLFLMEVSTKLQKIVNQRLNSKNARIYAKAEWKAHMIAMWPTLSYILIYDLGFALVTLFCWMRDLLHGKVDVTKWYNINMIW